MAMDLAEGLDQEPRRRTWVGRGIVGPQRRQGDIGWLPNDRLWIDFRVLIPESKDGQKLTNEVSASPSYIRRR